jgi:hypothetical protein
MFKNTITELSLGFDIVCSFNMLWYGQEMCITFLDIIHSLVFN